MTTEFSTMITTMGEVWYNWTKPTYLTSSHQSLIISFQNESKIINLTPNPEYKVNYLFTKNTMIASGGKTINR